MSGDADYSDAEFLITTVARLIETPDVRHVAVGAASPIPGAAALLVRKLKGGTPRVSLIHGKATNPFTDGGREIFDCAGQGRVDVFFLGGVQIDGEANINLVGTGDYPKVDKRFPGSFGSAYMYFVVPKVILFRPEHTRRVFVPKVDFVSAPGLSAPDVRRPGGPKYLVTELCVMSFDAGRGRFRLESVTPGRTVEEVRDNTGFEIEIPDRVAKTLAPEPERLALLRSSVGREIADVYPGFARDMLGVAA
ncbi:MAG: CoA synthetase [Proteobacteria bacterium]|nr:CoA synthetase [Pseudomonadota bacterium]